MISGTEPTETGHSSSKAMETDHSWDGSSVEAIPPPPESRYRYPRTEVVFSFIQRTFGVKGDDTNMSMQLATHTPPTVESLLEGIRLKSHTDIAFLARRIADGHAVQVTNIVGAETGTMADLVVRRGAGLGGKALALLRPVSVTSYRSAAGITHDYDAQVLGEHIEMLSAFPVSLGGTAPYVVYLGRRTPTRIGDRWYDQVTPLLRDFSSALFSPQPLPSDAKTQQKAALSRAQLDAALIELEELAAIAGNGLVRSRLERLRVKLATPEAPTPELETPLTA